MVGLLAIYSIAIVGAPLGYFLILLASIASLNDRPRRAWAVLVLAALLAVPVLWALSREYGFGPSYGETQLDWMQTGDQMAEMAALVLGIGLVLAVLGLLLPKPANPRAGTLGVIGLLCWGGVALAVTALAGTNLGL